MKAAGMEYDQRMEELEKLEHPKPLREFVYSTFNEFADRHPWVGEENIRPKSIAREMFEGFRSFSDYVQEYDLERAEGLLLRHLNSVYKVLRQTVPDAVKTDAVVEMELYLRDMLRQVDSSLLEEWERMRDPDYRPPGAGGGATPTAAGRGAGRDPRYEGLHRRDSHRGSSPSSGPGRSERMRTRSTFDLTDGAEAGPKERLRAAREAYLVDHRGSPPRPRGAEPPPHAREPDGRRDHLADRADAGGRRRVSTTGSSSSRSTSTPRARPRSP